MKRNAVYFILMLAVTALACFNMPATDFIGDDIGRIVIKPHVYEYGLDAAVGDLLPDRPVMMATIWANYALGGLNPTGYKLVNIFIHLLCGFAIFFLFKELFRKLNNRDLLACAVACIFLAHPINNQAVMSIIQRGVGLSTLFALLSFLFLIYYVSKEQRQFYLVSLLCFLLAIASKPNTAMLPLIFAVYLFFETNLKKAKIIKIIFPYILVLAIPLFFYQALRVNSQALALSGLDYFLVQTKVVALYFQKYLLPIDLHFFYDFNNDTKQFIDTSTPFFVIFHILFLGFTIFRYAKHRSLWALGIIFGYLALLPESSFFSILHPAFDHRNYFPMIFFASSFVLLCSYLLKNTKHFTALIAALVLMLGFLNISYTAKINTYEKWVLYNFEKNPTYRPHYIYHISLALGRANYAFAQKLIAEAKTANPKDQELDFLKSFENFENETDPEKLKIIESTFEYACTKGLTIEVLYYYENLLNKHLPKLTDLKTFTYKLNRLYFTFFKLILADYIDPQMLVNAESNFISVLSINKRLNPSPDTFFENIETIDALIALRNLIALKYYFGYQNVDVDKYESILRTNYGDEREAQTILAWMKTLPR